MGAFSLHRNENNDLHREEGPAVEFKSGLRQWAFNGRLHNPAGPAVLSDAGTRMFYWNGVRIPDKLWDATLTPKDVIEIENLELRRAVVEKHGYGIMMESGEILDSNSNTGATLYKVLIPDDEDLIFVQVKDGSDPDQEYFLRVPPNMQFVDEAIAWTFDMSAKEYMEQMRVET